MPDKLPNTRWQHDLKNQLGVVLGFAELLMDGAPPDHPMRADLEEILTAARSAMALVEQLHEPDENGG
jgi:signal transduction histidine kinase